MIKKLIVFVSLLLGCLPLLLSQKYYSKTAKFFFVSEAPVEKIEGINSSGYVIVDVASGAIEMSVLIKGFKFEKALMQDHFNENYMESSAYPKGIFKGSFTNLYELNFSKDGEYTAMVKGNLTLHGITKPLTTTSKITVKGSGITARSNFDIAIVDFGIQVPKVVRENIAKTVTVSVQADLQRM
ncbi:MAG: YceI family protein [Bacteroidota bacterium]|nr:YceI family protein [Bacteroidota bacterium]